MLVQFTDDLLEKL